MSSCESCYITNRGQQEQLSNVRKKAKDYAVEKKVQTAIYKEGYEYFFTDAATAITNRYHIIEYISQHL